MSARSSNKAKNKAWVKKLKRNHTQKLFNKNIVLRKFCGKTKINGVNNNRTRVEKMKKSWFGYAERLDVRELQMKANIFSYG